MLHIDVTHGEIHQDVTLQQPGDHVKDEERLSSGQMNTIDIPGERFDIRRLS